MRITIVGAGAIGGTVGAYLSDAGYDVTLVDIVPEHVRIMNEEGLRIIGIRGDRRYRIRAILAQDLTGPLETVLLCVKGHFTEEAMRRIAPLVAPSGYVVSLQNGLNEELIAGFVGADRTVGAFVHFGADYLEPGLIQLGQEQDIHLGELDGTITPRLEVLRSVLNHVMPTHLTSNIWGFLWGKLVYGSMAFAVSTVDAPVPEVLAHPQGRHVARMAAAETARVATAQGYRMELIGRFDPNAFVPEPGWEARADATLDGLAAEMARSIKQHMGIWRDLKIKKRRTEVDMQCGVVVERARELGIPAPVNEAILQVIHEIERGERDMGLGNLDVLAAAIRRE